MSKHIKNTVRNFLTKAAALKLAREKLRNMAAPASKVSPTRMMNTAIEIDDLEIEVRKAWQALSLEIEIPAETIEILTGLKI